MSGPKLDTVPEPVKATVVQVQRGAVDSVTPVGGSSQLSAVGRSLGNRRLSSLLTGGQQDGFDIAFAEFSPPMQSIGGQATVNEWGDATSPISVDTVLQNEALSQDLQSKELIEFNLAQRGHEYVQELRWNNFKDEAEILELDRKLEEAPKAAEAPQLRERRNILTERLRARRDKLQAISMSTLKDPAKLSEAKAELQASLGKAKNGQQRQSIERQIVSLDKQIEAVKRRLANPDAKVETADLAAYRGGTLGIASRDTYVVVKVITADGKVEYFNAKNVPGGDHAEDVAIANIRASALGKGEAMKGARVVIYGDQEVCKRCAERFPKWAQEFGWREIVGITAHAATLSREGSVEAPGVLKAKSTAVKVSDPADVAKREAARKQSDPTAGKGDGVLQRETFRWESQEAKGGEAIEAGKPAPVVVKPLSAALRTIPAPLLEPGAVSEPQPTVTVRPAPSQPNYTAQRGEPMGPLSQGGPSPIGDAVGGVGQLLVDIEVALSQEAAYRNARKSQSLRTLHWWLLKGVYPQAAGVTDRWAQEDERETDLRQIVIGANEGRFDGIELEAPNRTEQYETFERWVRANVHTFEDLYLHFIHDMDPGVRWNTNTGAFEVVSWQWGDMPPANVSDTWTVDPRINKFMQGIETEIYARTQQETANLSAADVRLGKSGEFKLGAKRRFREGHFVDHSFQYPETGFRPLIPWHRDPVFYEIEHSEVPPGFALVTGADARTYWFIVEARARYGHAVMRPTLSRGGSDALSLQAVLPETGWKDLTLPVVLVNKDSLE